MKTYFGIVVGVLLLMSGLESQACGKLKIRAGDIADLWSRRSDLQNQFLDIERSDSKKACRYFITFTSGQGNNQDHRVLKHGHETIPYQLYQSPFRNESQILKALPANLQPNNIIQGSFGEGGSGNERRNYFYGVEPEANPLNFPGNGSYQDSFTISIYQGELGSTQKPDDTVHVQVRLQVPRMIALSLVGTGAAFRLGDTTESMDFGILRTGDAKDFDLRVITNSGYKITFSSANNGSLRHAFKEVKTEVPYQLSVDQAQKSLTGSSHSPVTVARGGRGQDGGVRKNVRVTIGDVQDKMAGRYTDVITIVATAVE